ncbi:MAG TPA: two-component sensor histidine kinase, partial [Salinimicrobium sp.]|nr:two-component sensor histidine kinase [Salinimicrobium sp.]
MKSLKLSLRTRIFFSMILLVLLASILIAGVTVFQYRKEAKEYHRDRLERKEEAIKENIRFVIGSTTYEVNHQNIVLILMDRHKIHEISQVHNMPLNIYSLEGELILKSNQSFFRDTTNLQLDPKIIEKLSSSSQKRLLLHTEKNGKKFLSSYTFITDNKFMPLAILNLPYLQDDYYITRDLNQFLVRLVEVYLFMLVIAIFLAYLLSKYITRSLKTVSEKIKQTRLNKRNQKIEIGNTSEEIYTLVSAYNSMIDELEESAVRLAKSEREQAWREMAKQVAHEIKNP